MTPVRNITCLRLFSAELVVSRRYIVRLLLSEDLLHVPSSPSSIFGGGISIIFFKAAGNELGAPVAVSRVITIGSPDILPLVVVFHAATNKKQAQQLSRAGDKALAVALSDVVTVILGYRKSI